MKLSNAEHGERFRIVENCPAMVEYHGIAMMASRVAVERSASNGAQSESHNVDLRRDSRRRIANLFIILNKREKYVQRARPK